MGDSSDKNLSAAGKWVGAFLLVVYIGLVFWQWANVDAADVSYGRRSELLDGLEALAFAAAGAILGTTVQRKATKKAEEQADAATQQATEQKQRADANQAAAEKGRALVNMVAAKAKQPGRPLPAPAGTTLRTRSPSGDDGGAPAASEFQEMLDFIEQYDQSR